LLVRPKNPEIWFAHFPFAQPPVLRSMSPFRSRSILDCVSWRFC